MTRPGRYLATCGARGHARRRQIPSGGSCVAGRVEGDGVYSERTRSMARTVREQQDKRREEKLKQVQEQVDEGSLVIRKMTKEERKENPAKPRPKDKRKKR